jgi:hypothetical protein
MPNSYTISSVVQESFNITAFYTDTLQTISVADYAGNLSTYNLYSPQSSIPYFPAELHTITRI